MMLFPLRVSVPPRDPAYPQTNCVAHLFAGAGDNGLADRRLTAIVGRR